MTLRNASRLTAALIAMSLASRAVAADWMQFGYDPAHSGNNPVETTLSPGNVALLVPRYATIISEVVDGAPVYLSNVTTSAGTRNLLFAFSRNGKVLAIDAATGSIVWSHATTGATPGSSSPAIDPNRAYVYSHGVDGKIHKYQVGDGTEVTSDGWPQTATVKPSYEKANGGLAIAVAGGTSYLYSIMSGFDDSGDYQGHLTTVNLATNQQTVFNGICSNFAVHIALNECSSLYGGIWGRGGATFDAARQRIYITTGNGPYDANTNGSNWGDSVLSLAPDGTGATPGVPYDSYTPPNYATLGNTDTDLGSMSLALVPVPAGSSVAHVGMQGGKDDGLRLINLDDMSGQSGPRHVGGELQSLPSTHEYNGAREQAAIWVNTAGDGATWVFFGSFRNGLTAYKLSLGASNVPMLTLMWTHSGPSIASTSPVVANGVLYHVGGCASGDANCLVARDPTTGNALWTSAPLGAMHWQSPIVVDGSVYVFTPNSGLTAFSIPGSNNDIIFANGFDGAN